MKRMTQGGHKHTPKLANPFRFATSRQMDLNCQQDKDLHRKLAAWDRKLPTAGIPSYDSLVEFLCRRIVSSDALFIIKSIVGIVIRCLLYFMGFKDAHNRLQTNYSKDPVNQCWYCPNMADDRFGIRPGETFFDASTFPSQVQISYAIVLRGIAHDPSTSIIDGLGEDAIYNGNLISKDKLYPPGFHTETCFPMLHRASLLILSILKAREFYTRGIVKPDEYKSLPLTMEWYSLLFSTSMQFHRELIERYTAPREYSRHVTVMYREGVYVVEIIRTDVMGEEVMPTYEEIKRQLERVVQMDRCSAPLQVSTITTLSVKERHTIQQSLIHASDRNKHNLATIRDSLLAISLDPDELPRTSNDALYCLQSKNSTNRWYDRSVNLVVFGNGVAGFVMNYLAGMTGTVASSFVGLVKSFEEKILTSLHDEYLGCHGDQIKLKELKAPSYLSWDDDEDMSICKRINQIIKSKEVSGPFSPLSQVSFKLNCDITRSGLIKRGVSPSGAFHAALQLALLRISGRHTSVFEIISIRNFKFGGLAWMETNTADMNSFLIAALELSANPESGAHTSKDSLITLLQRAIASYRENVVHHKRGEVNLWHLDSIYRTLGLQTRLPRQRNRPKNLRSLFQQPFVDFLTKPSVGLLPPLKSETFTSNPGWNPAVEAVGRVGVKGIVPLAVHYLFSKTAMSITVGSSITHPCHGNEGQLAKELDLAMKFIKELLDTRKN